MTSSSMNSLHARPAKVSTGTPTHSTLPPTAWVCHGVPSAADILQDGDIVNFDITLEKNGYIADSSKTYLVGDVPPPARRLVHTAYEAM